MRTLKCRGFLICLKPSSTSWRCGDLKWGCVAQKPNTVCRWGRDSFCLEAVFSMPVWPHKGTLTLLDASTICLGNQPEDQSWLTEGEPGSSHERRAASLWAFWVSQGLGPDSTPFIWPWCCGREAAWSRRGPEVVLSSIMYQQYALRLCGLRETQDWGGGASSGSAFFVPFG